MHPAGRDYVSVFPKGDCGWIDCRCDKKVKGWIK
jgi:hypothetical protein